MRSPTAPMSSGRRSKKGWLRFVLLAFVVLSLTALHFGTMPASLRGVQPALASTAGGGGVSYRDKLRIKRTVESGLLAKQLSAAKTPEERRRVMQEFRVKQKLPGATARPEPAPEPPRVDHARALAKVDIVEGGALNSDLAAKGSQDQTGVLQPRYNFDTQGDTQMCLSFQQSVKSRLELETPHLTKANSLPFEVSSFKDKILLWPGSQKASPKIMCSTYTYHKKHGNVIFTQKYWGHRCDRYLVFTDEDEGIKGVPQENIIKVTPPGGESYKNMWHKMREILKYHGKHTADDYDYFFFGGDDVFLIVENLRKALLEPEIAELNMRGVPLWFGHRLQAMGNLDKYFVSGGGYVMNRVVLKLLIKLMDQRTCHPNDHSFAEDVYVADCLRSFGIFPRDGADVFGEDRFMSMNLAQWVGVMKFPKTSWWYPMYRVRALPKGMNCVSAYPALFHFMRPADMKAMGKQLYPDIT